MTASKEVLGGTVRRIAKICDVGQRNMEALTYIEPTSYKCLAQKSAEQNGAAARNVHSA